MKKLGSEKLPSVQSHMSRVRRSRGLNPSHVSPSPIILQLLAVVRKFSLDKAKMEPKSYMVMSEACALSSPSHNYEGKSGRKLVEA